MPPTIAGVAYAHTEIRKQSAMRIQYMVRIMPKTRIINSIVIYIFDIVFRFNLTIILAQMTHNVIEL